ncbi:hypothetical protein [Nocardia salmonicida]|uniref:hypothetical protein n=1 Tax=Nocardia salmonicida TaxID=53431 RepID=UPI0033D6E300
MQSTGIPSPQIPPSISPQDRVAIEQSVVGQLLFDAPSTTASVPQLPPTQQELDTSRVNQILPEGVTPPVRGGPSVVWVDGNNTQGSLFIDEFGVRHWDYLLANGVSIKVEQGGGSDGADRPWTNTRITQPGASMPVVDTYATQGVTSYIDTVDGRDVNVVLFQGGDIGFQTQDVDGGMQTTQITPSGPYSTYTSAAGMTWQSAFGNRLFTRFSGTDGSVSEESGSVDQRGAGEGYFTYPNGIQKNYTTVDGVIANGHYVDREGVDLGGFTQVNGITTFTPSQVYIDSYIREQGVTGMRVVYDPANSSAQTYYRLVNLAEEQRRDLESGDIPGIEWTTPIPQRGAGIIEYYKSAFSVLGDELSDYWTGPLIATMNARAGSNGISFPSYEAPAEKEHTAGEVFWAAVAVADLATLFLPIPLPRARWLAVVRNGGKTSPPAAVGPTTAPLPGGRSFTDRPEPNIVSAPTVIPAHGPNPAAIPGNQPLTIDVRSFPDNRPGLMVFRADDEILIRMPKVKPMPQIFDVGIHGAPKYVGLQVRDGQADLPKNWRNFSHREVSRILQGHGWVPGQPIRLLSCRTGMNPDGFAQNLSNRLGVAVYAPTEILWIYPNGRIAVAPYGKNGKMHPTIRGTFQWFYPSGPKK